jgi:hypothetical protein
MLQIAMMIAADGFIHQNIELHVSHSAAGK